MTSALELALNNHRPLEKHDQELFNHEPLDIRWKEAVLLTIRCAAFTLAKQADQQTQNTSLFSYFSIFGTDNGIAQKLIDGPLTELLMDNVGNSLPSGRECAELVCKLYELTLNLVAVESLAGVTKVQIADKARKRSGSFYTPTTLAKLTVESALEPLLKDRDADILQLRILDPAMGAGIFLLAAHEYLREFARTGSQNTKDTSRLIAQNCIHGVDIDEVSVEVAKLALWLAVGDYELHPLTAFPNLRVGNSLVGTREELAGEFPSAIWKRKDLAGSQPRVPAVAHAKGLARAQTRIRLDRYCAYWFMSRQELLDADLFNAKDVVLGYKSRIKFFHWNTEFPEVFTTENPGFDAVIGNPPWEIEKPNSREFFGSFKKEYWNLGKQDAIKTQDELKTRFPELEQEWLRIYRDHYAMANWVKNAPLQFGAGSFEYQGRGDANLYKLFAEQAYYLAKDGGAIGLIVPSGIYSDCGTRELRQLLLDKCDLKRIVGFDNSDGAFDIHRSFKYCVFVATKGGATEKTGVSFMNTAAGVSIASDEYDRQSIERISPKWSVICEVENRRSLELLDKIYGAGIRLGNCEINGVKLQYAREFDMTLDSKLFHARERVEAAGAVQDIFGNWLVGKWRDGSAPNSQRGSATNSQGIFQSASGDKFLSIEDISKVFVPLYEGRMIGQFDHNEKQWLSGKGRQAVWRPTESKNMLGPQYLVEVDAYKERRAASFKTGFLAVGSPTNARTMISTCLSEVACGNSVPVFFVEDSASSFRSTVPQAKQWKLHLGAVEFQLLLTSIFNSFVFDYALRRRMSGNNLNYFVLEECSIPNLQTLNAVHSLAANTIVKLVKRLVLDAPRFGAQLASIYCASVPPVLDQAERTRLRAGIDALVAHLYGLSGEEFQVVLTGEANQKGFWRVDKDLPEHQSLTCNALRMYERLLEIGVDEFCRELVLSLEGGDNNRCADALDCGKLLSIVLR